MKHLRLYLSATLLVIVCSAFAQGRTKNVYAFGFAASFKDSVAYLTDIQVLDSVRLERNTGFLPMRDQYSYQLKNYLEYDMGKPQYVCMIFFSKKLKKIQKEFKKIKTLYTKGNVELVGIEPEKFKFKKPEY